jgi:hypothetical protein
MNSKKISLLLLLFTIVFGQNSPEELVEKFFLELENTKGSVAVENLYKTNAWVSRVQDAITTIKTQIDGLTVDFVGKYHGYEKITSKSVGDSYVILTYLVKYDRQPIRFSFHFYKPDNKWMIYSFSYDDSIDEELTEAAKIYYLKNNN